MIGIIIADENEINKFEYPQIDEKKINQFYFKTFNIEGKNVVTVCSGIGIANAASATQALIENFDIKIIYNYGAVGGTKKVKLFDIIYPKYIYYHDVITPWYKRGQTPGEKPFYKNNIKNSNVNLASGSSFITTTEYYEKLEFRADIFDMETAAIAQVCDKNKIRLNVIKCVSDILGDNSRSVEEINESIKKAGEFAFKELISYIKN